LQDDELAIVAAYQPIEIACVDTGDKDEAIPLKVRTLLQSTPGWNTKIRFPASTLLEIFTTCAVTPFTTSMPTI
jgi:hypothetical protein